MKLEQLLDCSADKLEAMTDAQLIEYLSPFFNVTRPPDKPIRQTVTAKHVAEQFEMIDQMSKASLLAKQHGIDISGVLKNALLHKKK